ncbi:MAG: HAD family hydrolase [Turicibacter sanguinis]
MNDLEMMQSVYHSFAMANAHEQLKQFKIHGEK